MRVPVELTVDDLIKAHRFHEQSLPWYRRWHLITLGLVLTYGVIDVLAIVVGLIVLPSNSNITVKYYSIASFGILVNIVVLYWYPRRHSIHVNRNVRRNKIGFKLNKYEIEVDSYGVRDHEDQSTTAYAWHDIAKIVCSSDAVYIFVGNQKAIIIPGRCFSNEEFRQSFQQVLERYYPRSLIHRKS